MAGLSISRAWDETKARIAADGKLIGVVAAALLLLPQALVGIIAPPEQLSGVTPSSWVNLLELTAAMIGMIGQIAIIHLSIVHAASVGEAIAHGVRRFLPALGAAAILVLAMFVVLVPIIIMIGGVGDMEAAEAGTLPQGIVTAVALIVLLAFLVGPRFMLMMAIAAAEAGGPIHILKRAWSLSSGHYFRLLAFMILVFIAAIIIIIAIQFGVGSLITLLLGGIEPFSIGALIFALLIAACQAAFGAIFSVMLARIYVQLSGQSLDVTVPKSGI